MLESLWPESLQLCCRETPTGMFSVSAPVVATPVGGCCCWGVRGGGGCGRSRDVWGWLRFWWGVASCVGGSISLLAGELVAGVLLSGVLGLS